MNVTVKTVEAVLLLLAVMLLAMPAAAQERFEDPQLRERFSELTRELRCPKCQNESIAESGAPISEDMRERVRRMMREGATDEEIRQAMVDRFGSFVSYRPEFAPRTWALWIGPFVALVIGVGVVLALVARNRARRQLDSTPLSDEERRRAEQWLRDE
ncbi:MULTISPECIES: cytochrome c-type biogenesis protein [Gammaproteobacteria]|uniref:Cytochrome c-type biogenesis protein n=1 Tax=Vreelandella halophila TaxID=86177 RepID=A0A9X4YD98_9GAMM|nr:MULTISPECIES: cytochrome c-type biogenesis protein [Gammaproteobacteria]KAA8984268.1 cytochrome c-type biogenesis protein CcmH [Halospina sp. K52047b]MYL27008.1 cytochrome c-type biogenesis protein CcmH [Halomonas utahensis]MYL75810.1 cytochrome c-type biogenesis protein CcmH [Halomonas sp. 22501_18_FS]